MSKQKVSKAPETIIAKLRKIRQMAERGSEAEREVAQAKLVAMLEANGLTLESLLDKPTERKFKYNSVSERKLLIQIVSLVTGDQSVSFASDKKKKLAWFTLTDAQFADVTALWNFHQKAFYRWLAEQWRVYASENGIAISGDQTMSEEEIAELLGIQRKAKAPVVINMPKNLRPEIAAMAKRQGKYVDPDFGEVD